MTQHKSAQTDTDLVRSLIRLAAKLRAHRPANDLMSQAGRVLVEASGRLQKATQPIRRRWVLDLNWSESERDMGAALRSLAAARSMARRVHSRLADSKDPHLGDLLHIERVIRAIDELQRHSRFSRDPQLYAIQPAGK